MGLSDKKCRPCENGATPMSNSLIKKYLKEVKKWKLRKKKLYKEFKLKNSKETKKFVDKIWEIAEKEGHHPDIYFTWGKCNIELFTHSINGMRRRAGNVICKELREQVDLNVDTVNEEICKKFGYDFKGVCYE